MMLLRPEWEVVHPFRSLETHFDKIHAKKIWNKTYFHYFRHPEKSRGCVEHARQSNLLVGCWEVGMMSSVWRVSLMLLCNMAATNTIQRVTVNIPGKRQKQTNNIFIGLLLTYQVEDRRRKEKKERKHYL